MNLKCHYCSRIQEEEKTVIHPAAQVAKLRKKNKRPIIYHQVNVTIDTGALTIQLSTSTTNLSKIVMMAVCPKWGTFPATSPLRLVDPDLSTQNTTFLILRSGTSATGFVAEMVPHCL